MARDVLQNRFLSVLAELGGSAGNGRLQSALGWEDSTYWRVQPRLVDAGLVHKGRGRGGSVSLANGEAAATSAPAITTKSPVERSVREPRAAKRQSTTFQQIFKNIDDVLWKEAGCTTELDYTEQTSWMLFLKYLDDLETDREAAADISDIQERDRYQVILANPPFGGKERPEVQQNFPIKTGETAFLFLQHFMKSLKAGGRAAVVIKNTFLSNTDNAAVALTTARSVTCT
jgi:hypothetical protein